MLNPQLKITVGIGSTYQDSRALLSSEKIFVLSEYIPGCYLQQTQKSRSPVNASILMIPAYQNRPVKTLNEIFTELGFDY